LTSGISLPPKRSGRCNRAYLPARAFTSVSTDGVAETSTTGTRASRARTTAMSRA
jgi:hypothetical protein